MCEPTVPFIYFIQYTEMYGAPYSHAQAVALKTVFSYLIHKAGDLLPWMDLICPNSYPNNQYNIVIMTE